MASTTTAGITSDAEGRLLIDKIHCGTRIYLRLGQCTVEVAERRLASEMAQAETDFITRGQRRPLFSDCAALYLAQRRDLRSMATMEVHVRLLLPHIGHLPPHQVHDATLKPFISERIAASVSATTINRSLEMVRSILSRAARSFRDSDGRPWLDAPPPLITMLPESRRQPYPITWDEQDRLFPRLPARLQRMVLFAVNTGLRDNNVCGLRWDWEVQVPEVGRSVFIIPAASFKTKRNHVVVLNDAAWSIVQAQRGLDSTWVFPYHGKRIDTMNNTAWQRARRETNLRQVRVHDLRHTFACRLRAAGVTAEDRAALLGHAVHSMSGHYASPDVQRLMGQANLALIRQEIHTLLRVANGYTVVARAKPRLVATGHATVTQ